MRFRMLLWLVGAMALFGAVAQARASSCNTREWRKASPCMRAMCEVCRVAGDWKRDPSLRLSAGPICRDAANVVIMEKTKTPRPVAWQWFAREAVPACRRFVAARPWRNASIFMDAAELFHHRLRKILREYIHRWEERAPRADEEESR